MYERAKKGLFTNNNVPVVDLNGQIISRDSLVHFNRNQFAITEFVDCNNIVVKQKIRKITAADISLRKKIDSLYSNNINLKIKRIKFIEKDTLMQKKMIEFAYYSMPLISKKTNCDSASILLSKALYKDQSNRSAGKEISLMLDRENMIILKSVIDNCGFSKIEELGSDAIYSAFMIAQHGFPQLREEYFDYFHKSVEKGLLNSSSLALMVDRMLIEVLPKNWTVE